MENLSRTTSPANKVIKPINANSQVVFKLQGRKKTRIVAYIDLSLSIISLLLLICNSVLLKSGSVEESVVEVEQSGAWFTLGMVKIHSQCINRMLQIFKSQIPTDMKVFVILYPFLSRIVFLYNLISAIKPESSSATIMVNATAILIGTVVTFIQMLSATRLLQATESSQHPGIALKQALFWRNTNIGISVLYALFVIATQYSLSGFP